MNIFKSGKVLVTTNEWFKAKDGQQYKAVWGTAKVMKAEDLLGFKPSRSANWFLFFDAGDDSMIVGGCQISYAQVCHDEPQGIDVLKLG